MAAYLLVAEGVAPLEESESAAAAVGLARGLAAAGHQVVVLALAPPTKAGSMPGLARRLRTVTASTEGRTLDLPLFEGRSSLSSAQLCILGAEPRNRGEAAALLGTATAALVADGQLKSDVAIGWGETSAVALAALPAATRLFVLPTGAVGPPLTDQEIAALGPAASTDGGSGRSLAERGTIAASAVVLPSLTAAREAQAAADLAGRASDEPLVAAVFGCDDPPHDPSIDQGLAATYGADSPNGKAECRRALAKRTSLALGPRTLLLATGPLRGADGALLLKALGRLTDEDVAVVIPAWGDRTLLDHANVLSIEHAGKVAIIADDSVLTQRQVLAGADALLLGDRHDLTGRAAGLGLRYGTLPLAPDAGAYGDFLVDYDPTSATGSALLYTGTDPFEILGVVRRAVAMRSHPESWPPLVKALLLATPRWSATVAILESLREISPVA